MPKKLRVVFCALTLVFVVALIVVFTFRVHILFAYQLHTNETPFVDIKISELSNNPVPQNWETFTIGSVTFQVPPGFEYLYSNGQTGKEKQIYRNGITVLKKEKMLLIFDDFDDPNQVFSQSISEEQIKKRQLTWPKFCLECYRFKPDSFRWSMTNDEVVWQAVLFTFRKTYDSFSTNECLYSFTEDRDAILEFGENKRSAILRWQDKNSPKGGYINVQDRSKDLDVEMGQSFCKSIQIAKSNKAP